LIVENQRILIAIEWKTGLLRCYLSLVSLEKGNPAEPSECYPGSRPETGEGARTIRIIRNNILNDQET